MLSKKIKKLFAREAENLLTDMQKFRDDHTRISTSIAESKKNMEEKNKKRKLIRNK
ncbi:hypothetical protein [Bacillus wiedmannii]|uniref:hypothetical protein n=1 Tax=Bacillus wiedmannii TaxID=1890302 RepID=UPI00159BDE47|nr:hypothetical protein [Bacillus wiedmannii]